MDFICSNPSSSPHKYIEIIISDLKI